MARPRDTARIKAAISRQSNSPRDPGYGIDNHDEAAQWLAKAEPNAACSHTWATIQPHALPAYRFCLSCKARRPIE